MDGPPSAREADERADGARLSESAERPRRPDGPPDGRGIIGDALAKVIAQWRAPCWQLQRMRLVPQMNELPTPLIGLLLGLL